MPPSASGKSNGGRSAAPPAPRLELGTASYRPGGNQAQPAQEGGSYGPWTDIPGSNATTTSHTVTGLTNGKTYGFRIRAVNAGGNGDPSAEIRVTLRQPPLKPTGVTATAGDGQVTLAWDGPTDATISKWQVQQKEGSGSYSAWRDVLNSTASTRSHTVTGLTNGTAYGFRIRAVNAAGDGAVSDEVTATPVQLPSKPTGVTAAAGDGQVTLTWDNPDDATITRWQVQQKQGSGSYGPWRDIPNSTASTTTYTVTGLTNGTAYSFRIRAVNAAGNGAPSDEARATPVHPDRVQADKARRQALAATSRTLLGMATDVLGDRTNPDAPMALAGSGDSLGNQAMGVVENLLGIGGSELPTSLTLEEVEDRLWSQSFQLSPPAEANPSEGSASQQQSWAFWGAGELRSYRSEEEEGLSSSGNLRTAWLGVDYPFTHRGLAGLALSFSSGQSDYTYRKTDGANDGGRMDTRLTTFYPYGSFQVSEGLRLWAMAGIGWGSQHHQQTGDDAKAEGDLRLQMGVVGFEQALSPIGEVNLSLAGDAGLVKSTTAWQGGSGLGDLSVTLHRIRMGVDGSFPLAEHTTAYLNLKGRIDGGDLPMNAAELVAGVQYSQARFSGFLQGRQVYAFDGSYAESALTASSASPPTATAPAWGGPSSPPTAPAPVMVTWPWLLAPPSGPTSSWRASPAPVLHSRRGSTWSGAAGWATASACHPPTCSSPPSPRCVSGKAPATASDWASPSKPLPGTWSSPAPPKTAATLPPQATCNSTSPNGSEIPNASRPSGVRVL